MGLEHFSILSLVLSTLAFFVASHYARRYLAQSGIRKGMTGSMVVFSIALAVSYGVGLIVDRVLA
jgi:hypothetical protein